METKDKKQYITPEIIFETDLETKAGSIIPPSAPIDGIDLFPGSNE